MLGLLGGTSVLGYQPVSIGSNTLLGWYDSKSYAAQVRAQGPQLSGASSSINDSVEVTPPWDEASNPLDQEDLVRKVLASGEFIDTSLGEFSDLEAPLDHRQLFALHQGLKKLWAVAAEAAKDDTTATQLSFLNTRFSEGVAQLDSFLASTDYDKLSLVRGELKDVAESGATISEGSESFTTGVLHDGAFDAEVDAFTGAASFDITVRKASGTLVPVSIDLSEMDALPDPTRNLDNVAGFINSKLEAQGLTTRFERVKIGEEDENGIVPGTQFGFKINGSSSETLTFSASDATPAAYLVGVSGGDEFAAAGQITKFSDLSAAAPSVGASQRIEAVGERLTEEEDDGVSDAVKAFEALTGATIATTSTSSTSSSSDSEDESLADLTVKAAKASGDGGLFALAETNGVVEGGAAPREGVTDVTLSKYDSTGRLVWARTLGATEDAEGLSLAVSASGEAVVAGSLTGAQGETIALGGSDAFVAKFDGDGHELWLQRLGTASDDGATAVTVGDDGTVYVVGTVGGTLTGETASGGDDAFVTAFDADGASLWTEQLGSAGADVATSIAVSGSDLYLASVEDGAGVVRKFDVSGAEPAETWTHSLGDLDAGELSSIAVDGGSIYVAGTAGDGFAAIAGDHQGGRDAFVIKLNDGGTPSQAFATVLGTADDDAIADLTVSDGVVYVAGRTEGDLAGPDALSGDQNAFLSRVESDGTLSWTEQIAGRGGVSDGVSVVVDPAGSSVLDRFGLPSGTLDYKDVKTVAERTSARVGDHFYVSVNGGRQTKITLEEGDTLRDLTFKLGPALLLNGEATVWRSSGSDALRITPKEGVKIELIAGSEGSDLLAGLGLEAGVVEKDAEDDEDAIERYGLELPNIMSLSDKDAAAAAVSVLADALSTVRSAYRDLTTDPALKALFEEGGNAPTGEAPAYLTAQLANYQAALSRLNGGF